MIVASGRQNQPLPARQRARPVERHRWKLAGALISAPTGLRGRRAAAVGDHGPRRLPQRVSILQRLSAWYMSCPATRVVAGEDSGLPGFGCWCSKEVRGSA
jgi:hypothetical protein